MSLSTPYPKPDDLEKNHKKESNSMHNAMAFAVGQYTEKMMFKKKTILGKWCEKKQTILGKWCEKKHTILQKMVVKKQTMLGERLS